MKAIKNIIRRSIAGENFLIPVGEAALKIHGMITITESGALIWDELENECTEDDLVDVILREYDIDRETAKEDVKEFLAKMDALGLIVR